MTWIRFPFHVFLLWLLAQETVGYHHHTTCVNIPQSPVGGSISFSGQFTLRMTCNDPGTDLPLTVPKDGVLLCRPNTDNEDFLNLGEPQCLEKKTPKMLSLPFSLRYVTNTCFPDFVSQFTQAIVERREKLLTANPQCDLEQSCQWTEVNVRCDTSHYYNVSEYRKQIDVDFSIKTAYKSKVTLGTYQEVSRKFKSSMSAQEGLSKARELWGIPEAKLMYYEYRDWQASCKDITGTSGTSLALSHVASCRGCPQGWYYKPGEIQCVQCNFNFYTTGPFSTFCIPCTDEGLWGDQREKFIKLCRNRT